MLIKLREPIAPRYIYVNPTTNKVHLLVPIVGGEEVSTDNTCQTVVALQQFFGKKNDSVTKKNSAYHELKRYKKALEDDISILARDNPLRAEKQARLSQIKRHISTLTRIASHASLNVLSGAFPSYPASVRALLENQTNLYSMQLRPTHQDSLLRTVNPFFSVDRARPSSTLFHALKNAYETITPASIRRKTPKEQLIDRILAKLPTTPPPSIPQLQAMLTQEFELMFGSKQDFTTTGDGDFINEARLCVILLEDNLSDVTLHDKIECIIDACISVFPSASESPVDGLAIQLSGSASNIVSVRERLNIMTQFLLAETNIYAHTKKLSTCNFGALLDDNNSLAIELATIIKRAYESGAHVEGAVLNFINKNKTKFGLSREFNVQEFREISRRFYGHYTTIKDSPHFDEFMLLDPEKKGRFFTHQGSLCFDFSDLMTTADFIKCDSLEYRAERAETDRFTTKMPHKNSMVSGFIDVPENTLKADIRSELTANHLTSICELLLSELQDGRKVFQVISSEFLEELREHPKWTELSALMRGLIKDAALMLDYNRIVQCQNSQLLLTPEMARSLYVSIVSTVRTDPKINSQYNTPDAIKGLLGLVGLTNIEVEESVAGGFVVNAPQQTIDALFARVIGCSDKIHLTPKMAVSLYKEVTERFGKDSPEYRAMNALNNQGNVPHKLIKVLEILHISISPSNIEFPLGGENGYIIKGAPEDFRVIEETHNVQANRFFLTQNMARQLYVTVTSFGDAALLEGLTNEFRPDKLETALVILGINYDRVEFNDRDGYFVYLSEDEQQRILNVEANRISEARITGLAGRGSRSYGYHTAPALRQIRERAQLREASVAPAPAERLRGSSSVTGHEGQRRTFLAAAQPAVIAVPNDLTIQAVEAFRAQPAPIYGHQNLVQLNCPEVILQEFRRLLDGTAILGCSFINPYTGISESIPAQANQLTARHLQILARNERLNTTGVMNVALYRGLLTDDQIARLRCLVKATNVAGVVDANATGGYGGSPRVILTPPHKTIVIDQSGLQWQGDFRNTGGIFFYPDNPLNPAIPPAYTAWQAEMYQVMYGQVRPIGPSANSMPVTWMGVAGQINLNQVVNAIDSEFSQALDAAVHQGEQELASSERINLKFLKAGMGFFADGLEGRDPVRLEHARLQGIEQALRRIAALPEAGRRATLGKVGRIELPFSGNVRGVSALPPAFTQTISRIQNLVEHLGLQWGGTPMEDALVPKLGFVNATTNCGDPHAMIGNEGGHQSIDASIATNANINYLNPGFNTSMQLRISPACIPLPQAPLAAPPTVPVEPSVTTADMRSILAQGRGVNVVGQDLLKQIITQGCVDKSRGTWEAITARAPVIEIGISGRSGYSAIASDDYHIELQGSELVVLDKHNQLTAVSDPIEKGRILNQFLLGIPEVKLLETHLKWQVQKSNEIVPLSPGEWQLLGTASPESEWEFGRSSHSNNLAFASREFHIEFKPGGTIVVQDKMHGYTEVPSTSESYIRVLTRISNCFPELQQALEAAQPLVSVRLGPQ